MKALKIGEVVARGGVNLQTTRYYERAGLLPKPLRLAQARGRSNSQAVRRQDRARRSDQWEARRLLRRAMPTWPHHPSEDSLLRSRYLSDSANTHSSVLDSDIPAQKCTIAAPRGTTLLPRPPQRRQLPLLRTRFIASNLHEQRQSKVDVLPTKESAGMGANVQARRYVHRGKARTSGTTPPVRCVLPGSSSVPWRS